MTEGAPGQEGNAIWAGCRVVAGVNGLFDVFVTDSPLVLFEGKGGVIRFGNGMGP